MHECDTPRAPQAVFEAGIPVLGICYGQMTLVEQLGGKVEPADHREFGRAQLDVLDDCPLFDGVWKTGSQHQVWMSHGDRVIGMPDGFKKYAVSSNAPFALIADTERQFYGLMFHPAVVHTPDGGKLLANFALKIAGCKGDWTMAHFRTDI